MIRIDLGLSEKYLAHWTIQDALRELYQNAIDNGEDNWTSRIYTMNNNMVALDITTLDVTLDRDTLLLGETSKTGDDTIGKFGEGYKLAVLVLLRNGKSVTVTTGSEHWTFHLRPNDQFDVNILSVDIEEFDEPADESTTFTINNIPMEEYEEYRDKNLHLQDGYELVRTDHCEVLLDECNKGKLFIGGLYVCPYYGTTLYGYNFDVGTFQLGRDRNIVDGWDASWEASKAVVQAVAEDRSLLDKVLEAKGTRDTEHLNQFVLSNDVLSSAMWDRFIDEYPNSIPCSGYMLEDRLKDYIGGKFVVVPNRQFDILSKTTMYTEAMDALEKRDLDVEPMVYVKMFFDKYQDSLKEHFGELMLEAEKWEVK
ncbi:MAG: hypothetical protein DRP09_16390 [Candidatus Thorarchaeota archaeon]|nr:MAG: hypothetical protein DRP09_16390 [Candidatus Thorarchaeota archaeon]